MAQSLVHEKTDAVVYCNPDLFINSDFFTVLEHTLKTVVGGVIAPSILSLRDGFDLNPQYRKKLSRTKLKCLQRIYAYRLFFSSYNALGRIKEVVSGWNYWLRRGSKEASATIYAPHGAMFIFTDIGFFRRLPSFPCFLFGEELFVAEEARLAGVPVVYEPALRIHDVRHASVGLLPKEFLRVLCYKSVTFLLNRYYAVPEEK
jgi:GT2 family glycosyltransferase